tara:strand:- start:45 stop:488 length:444 start_codon:yes stop_codon:yes gene_type:complete
MLDKKKKLNNHFIILACYLITAFMFVIMGAGFFNSMVIAFVITSLAWLIKTCIEINTQKELSSNGAVLNLNKVIEYANQKNVEEVKLIFSSFKDTFSRSIAIDISDYTDEDAKFWKDHGFIVIKHDRNSSNEWMPGAEARYGLLLSL